MPQGDLGYLYVANVASGVDDGGAISGIAAGSVAVCTEAGLVEKGAATTGVYKIAHKLADGTLIFSPTFDMSKRKNVVGKSYAAPTQQTTYLGYNGTSGSLTVAADEDYVLNIEWQSTFGMCNNSAILVPGAYHTTAASQAELSLGLLLSLDGAMKRQAYPFVKMDRINNAAVTATNDFLGDATVVSGSKSFTVAESSGAAADAGQYATSTEIAVGDYVRLAGAGLGTALTSAVYKVTAVSGVSSAAATITVDRPLTVASGTYAAATHDIEVIPAASIGANFGLKFVGQENSTFDAINDRWAITRFDLMSGDFSRSDITTTAASEGSGYYKKVANMEILSQFLDKSPYISAMPRNNYRQETLSTKTYDLITFEIEDTVATYVSTGQTTSKSYRIQIAIDAALTGDDIDTVFGLTV